MKTKYQKNRTQEHADLWKDFIDIVYALPHAKALEIMKIANQLNDAYHDDKLDAFNRGLEAAKEIYRD